MENVSPKDKQGERLQIKCKSFSDVEAICLDTQGDTVVVGDIMQSVQLLQSGAEDGSLKRIAKDPDARWTTALQIMDDQLLLTADQNRFLHIKQLMAAGDEVKTLGRYHLGDLVNVFKKGSIENVTMDFSSSGDIKALPDVSNLSYYCTARGAIGVIIPISKEQYAVLKELQESLMGAPPHLAYPSHMDWRYPDRQETKDISQGFIDGDLVEQFMSMPEETRKSIVRSSTTLPSVHMLGALLQSLVQWRCRL